MIHHPPFKKVMSKVKLRSDYRMVNIIQSDLRKANLAFEEFQAAFGISDRIINCPPVFINRTIHAVPCAMHTSLHPA